MAIRISLQDQLLKKARRDGVELISYRQVRLATQISISTLSQLRTGITDARLSTVERLCLYFNCTPGDLLVLE